MAEVKREEIRNYFHKTFSIDEPLRHPLIFYFGHTAAFYINKLTTAKLIDRRINAQFESMFAVEVG